MNTVAVDFVNLNAPWFTFSSYLDTYAAAIAADYQKFCDLNDIKEQHVRVVFEGGKKKKYMKVFVNLHAQGHVHSFIVLENNGKFKTGDILKTATYDAPAKNFARGNVFIPGYKTCWGGT